MQKLLLCLSHQRTNALLDKLGENFDQDAHDWKHAMINSMVYNSLVEVFSC
jgi:hypothetical protein